MAEPTTNLRVRISADLADIKQGLGMLRGELAKVKAQGETALPNTQGFTRGLVSAGAALRGLFAGITVGAVFRGIIENTREAEDAIGQLRAGLKSTKGAAQVTAEEISSLAASLQQVTTYGDDTIVRMAAVLATFTKIRGAVFKDAIPAVLDLSTRLKVDLNSAAIQVGKALNDPLKGITALGRAGVQFSKDQKEQIKGFVESGQIVKAQQIILGELATQMGGSASAAADTFSGAIAQASNALGDLLEGDSSSGGMREAKDAIKGLASELQDASTKRAFASLLQGFATAVGKLVAALKSLMPVITAVLQNLDVLVVYLGTRLAVSAIAAAVAGFLRLQRAIELARASAITLRTALALIGGPVGIAIAALAAGIYYLATRENDATKAAKAHAKVMDELHDLALKDREAAINSAIAKREQAMASLAAAQGILAEARAQQQAANVRANLIVGEGRFNQTAQQAAVARGHAQAAQGTVDELQRQVDELTKLMMDLGKEGVAARIAEVETAAAAAASPPEPTTPKEESHAAIRGAVNEAELAADAIKRLLDDLDRRFQAREISVADYFRERTRLQLQAIDLEITQAKAEADTAKTTEAQSAALTRLVKLQRDRAEIGPQAIRDELAAEKDLHAERLRQLEEQEQAIQQRLRNTETAVGSQVGAGLMGDLEGERKIREARDVAIEQLRTLRASALAYLATLSPGSPQAQAVLNYLLQLNGGLADVQASQQRMKEEMKGEAVSAFRNLFADIRTGAKSAKDAVRSFFDSLMDGIARILEEKAATALVNWIVGLLPGGQSRSPSGSGGTRIMGPVMHAGGIVGQGGSWRGNLSPMLFGTAPRYHSGGIAGLAPDEVPAVLRMGEEVLTADDPRHRRNGGGQGVIDARVQVEVNNYGNDRVTTRQESAAGQGGEMLRKLVIDIVSDDTASGGKTARAQKSRFGLREAI